MGYLSSTLLFLSTVRSCNNNMARKKLKEALGVSGHKKKGKSSRKHLEDSKIDKEKEASGSEYFPSSDDEGKAHFASLQTSSTSTDTLHNGFVSLHLEVWKSSDFFSL
jgi:hypothetical protein